MSSRHPPKSKQKCLSAEAQEDDWTLLDTFCKAIEYEEIELEHWSETHTSLDLIYELRLSARDRRLGCKIQIALTRSIYPKSGSEQPTRSKFTHNVVVPSGASLGDVITYKGLGDVKGQQSGDLRIVLCL